MPAPPPDSLLPVRADNGVHLPELGLRLDPHRPCAFGFVSHAHADHFARHRRILCSTRTADLIKARYGRGEAEVIELEFGEPFELDGHRLKLLPAGHIFGSAQIHVRRLSDGASLLYTGDFKVRTGLSAEAPEFEEADTLVMETTFGLPHYVFPPTEEVIAEVIKFTEEALEDGEVPVLLGYSLGKAQEILSALRDAELPVLLHPAVHRMSEIYLRFQPDAFPSYAKLEDGVDPAGQVLIVPPNAARSQAVRRIKARRTAMMSGWAMNPGAKYRYQVDQVFPLSDHADYPGLIECVERVAPKRVLTLHGYAAEFANDLRALGYEAWSFSGNDQLELGFAADEKSVGTGDVGGSPATVTRAAGGFAEFVGACEAIAGATGKTRKVEILAKYLRHLPERELGIAATYLGGAAMERSAERGPMSVGAAVLRRSLLEASRVGEQRYREISATQNDLGRTSFLVLTEGAGELRPGELSLAELEGRCVAIADARGPQAKAALVVETLRALHPRDGSYFVRLLTGDLRIGLKAGLLEEAVASAFGREVGAVRKATMLLGSLAGAAKLAQADRLGEAHVQAFTPVLCMLASPENDSESIWARLGGGAEGERNAGGVWLEDKFDGIRAQLHKVGDRAEIYSRDLRSLSAEFREISAAAKQISGDFIADGEIIAYAEGKRLTFFDLQKRLGRRHDSDLFLGPSIPVRFVMFDLLWRDGEPLLDLSLAARRERLEALELPPDFERVAVHHASSPEAIDAEFKAARARHNEGLIAKDPASTYSPGRRGKVWLKLKKALSTLDVVVVKAQQGHGKRSHVLSDYTFAVRDTEDGELRVIGKAYSGLTDAEIERLTEHFEQHTLETKRRVRNVVPNVVLEIAFDSIRPSKRHDSGLALRFPRIKAWRQDKSADEIDTLDYARSLAEIP